MTLSPAAFLSRRAALLLSLPLLALAGAASAGSYQPVASGILVSPDSGPEKAVRLLVYGDGMIRVSASPAPGIDLPPSLMVTAKPVTAGYTVAAGAGTVTLRTARLSAEVRLSDGNVSFRDAAGNIILDETAPGSFAPAEAEGKKFLAITQQFNRGTDEGFYGLGQHQNGQMNYNGEDVELAQYNFVVALPFVVSTRNYGLLWDNNGISRFGNPRPYSLTGDGGGGVSVTGADGKPGWTANYYLGDRLAVTQREAVINYQHIPDLKRWPDAAKARTVSSANGQNPAGNAVETQRVVWTGRVTADSSGLHRFKLYASSYVKLFVDGKPVIERWRQNWHPWYHNFDLQLSAGKPVDVRIEWEPNAGYIALLNNVPRAEPDRHSLTMSSDLAQGIDYYVVAGKDMDGVIAGYRALTGKANMLPKWSYGFWQSRQRYDTQAEIIDVVEQYRQRQLPLDNIVLDWRYWRDDDWGSHEFVPERFPDPRGMIEKLHSLHARFMISVWPKFYPTTANYKELAAAGAVYTRNLELGWTDWVGPGFKNTIYDPYNPKGRAIYWRQIKERLGVLGVDAWWLDATEPDIHSNLSPADRAYIMGPTALGPGAEFFNSYSLVHVEGVYDGQRALTPDVRPFILTRSAFGGSQRASAAVWSGDVAARWDDFREQIPAGINFSMSGIPNWSHDIGGFAVEDRFTNADPAHIDEWRELNLRWFQFGAFSPIFRSHGEAPKREIYNLAPAGSPMYASMEWYDRLRYRLMPYIYTVAADTYLNDGTIMRGLVMDFPADPAVRNIADQYMFGPAFLVAPVTSFKARTRPVYLPAGTSWYDLGSGARHAGGQTITAAAPAERMPVFVRAGAIVPSGEVMQWTDQKPATPLTLLVYTGADGRFALYEDDGVSQQYVNGAGSRIDFAYDEARGTLTIGARQGSYPGMLATRSIVVRWMRPGSGIDGRDGLAAPVTYSGQPLVLRRPF